MPAKIFYDQDADLGLIKGRKIAIIGYGSQGHAHALNLKDSGQDVVVGLYKGSKSWAKAEKDGLKVMTVNDAAAAADIIMILLPDQTQRQVYEESIKGVLGKGKTLMFAHGFNIHFNQVVPLARRGRLDDRAQGARAMSCATSSPRARACRRSSRCTRTSRGRRGTSRWPTARASAARARASSRPRSRKRRRRISSASRRRCAAASRT